MTPSIELRYSRPLMAFGFIACLVAAGNVGYGGLIAFALSAMLGAFVAVLAVPVVVLLLWWALSALRAMLNTDPIVVIDADGITDHRQAQAFVPWDDIQRAQLLNTRGGVGIHIHFTEAVAQSYVGQPFWLLRIFNTLTLSGDRVLNLGTLSYRYREVEQALNRLHREHRVRTARQNAENEKVMRELRERQSQRGALS